ncbi:MAG: photosynthetic reaction center subunit H [Pseudomonadota bacterium]
MDYGTIVGNIDLAQVALYLFWAFFAALIIYLQRENMREGYPLVDETGEATGNQGPFPLPEPKTFKMPGDRPDVTVPNTAEKERDVAVEPIYAFAGTAFEPTGDPMADGVGPASWAERADEPEVDAHGHAKIQPIRITEGFGLAPGAFDPIGIDVISGDRQVVGKVSEMWIDVPEQLIRYYEIDLGKDGTRLIPKDLSRVSRSGLRVHSIYASQFAGVPKTKKKDVVTKLEEEKISAYYCGGKIYAADDRLNPIG